MPANPSFGPTRKACTRCRLHKRKCDKSHPSCSLCSRLGQAEICTYEESTVYPTPPALVADEALRSDPHIDNALTPLDIKAAIVTKLSDTDPREIIAQYTETIHSWFSIFSDFTLDEQRLLTWGTASVEFALICCAIVLLNCAPQQLQGNYTLHSSHKSMYLMSKAWITWLEGTGLNSIDFVKARLLITLFEVSHGFGFAAYLSIANVVRAADALDVFQQQDISQSSAENSREEHRLMWWGIAILDRYIATENGKLPPVTKSRPIPPESIIENPLSLQRYPSTAFLRLFEASTLLDHVHTTLHQPTSQISFNIEEVTTIVNTLTSFENVAVEALPENSKLFSSCLSLSSTALILAFDNGCKATCSGASISAITQATAALDNLIDDIVRRIAELNGDSQVVEGKYVPPFIIFLVYKAAAITTGRLQNAVEPEENLRRLRALRNSLAVMAQSWLAGEHYLNLLNEDTAPRILKTVGS